MPLLSRRGSVAKNECEAFLAFLRSDLWLIPISEFVEQRSTVFDRDPNLVGTSDTVETYQMVHGEFKKLVNDLLEAHCTDAGTTRDQLIGSLKAADQAKELSGKDRLLLEPLIAAQDFDVFVPMMMRKNIELQLQALKMIEHLNGLLPSSLKLGQEDAEMWNALFEEEESDRFILISVLKQSRAEWELDQRMRDDWQAQMEAALRESLREKGMLEEMRQREQALLEQALQKAENSFTNLTLFEKTEPIEKMGPKSVKFDEQQNVLISPTPTPSTSRSMAPSADSLGVEIPQKSQRSASIAPSEIKDQKESDRTEKSEVTNGKKRLSLGQVHALPQRMAEDKTEMNKGDLAYRALLKEREDISEGQLRNRMKYLRDQRDKLLQKKSREREKQLIEAARQSDATRPQTAKAARESMEQKSQVDEERRRIAAKIKAEVIGKKGN